MRRVTPLALAAALALGGCADGSDDPPGTGDSVTPAATGSAAAATADDDATDDTDDAAGTATGTAAGEDTQDTQDTGAATAAAAAAEQTTESFTVTEHGEFDEGWSMTFLPGTDQLLVAERVGALQLRDQASGEVTEVGGVPEVHHAGQAGLHDVIPGPTFEQDGTVYLSWVREHEQGAQGVVGRGTLDVEAAQLSDVEVLWEQSPESGDGHFSLRMLIADDHLFLTSGDRQVLTPAQETDTNLGKVLRLTLDGEPAPGNPWADEGGVAAEFWTIGHRNPLGIAQDSTGQIWVSEMGPAGGDELNLLVEGENYGWPEVSMGDHYDGREIPDHADGDGFHPPAAWWVPAISPGSLLIYSGDLFTGWSDSALLGGLSGQSLDRVALDGESAEPAAHWDMGARIRAVDEAPDGSIWLLEDESGGRLLELQPD